ncbi:MAG: hypothetical protein SynsKO_26550 [Synoicihabitans sp.]
MIFAPLRRRIFQIRQDVDPSITLFDSDGEVNARNDNWSGDFGPELANFGLTDVLEDPQIKVFDRNEEMIAANDDWGSPSSVSSTQSTASAGEITAATQTVGGFQLATDSKDAALLITLPPGPYTVSASASVNSDSGSGNALIEVYEVR